jgi:hypothetical protein
VFLLPPYSLVIGEEYTVTLIVQHLVTLKSSSASVSIFLEEGDVVAKITGSSSRTIRINDSIVIDATSSYDEDELDDISHLDFYFSCKQTFPVIQSDCPLTLVNLTEGVVRLSVVNTSLIGSVHSVSVIVVDKSNMRSSSASVTVTVLPSLAPEIFLRSINGNRVNPSSKIKLVADIKVASNSHIVWTIDDSSVDLNALSLSPVSRALVTDQPQTFIASLVLPGFSLFEGSVFTFSLHCFEPDGYVAKEAISIVINSPPLSGDFFIAPSEGVTIETSFLMQGVNWEDDDVPVTYQFAYESLQRDYVVNRGRSELTHTNAKLPAGQEQDDYVLSLQLEVFDALDASVVSYGSAKVTVGTNLGSGGIGDFVNNALTNSIGFTDDMKQAAAIASSLVNAVNCSSAPNCTDLNRNPCSIITGTCSECKVGFVGELGHKNSLCLYQGEFDSRRLSSWTSLSTIGAVCFSDNDCNRGQWEACVRGVCAYRLKSCVNNCSDEGTCVFTTPVNPNLTFSECSLVDFDCFPKCVCNPGYGSPDCSLTKAELSARQGIRQAVLDLIRDISLIDDATRENVAAWISALAALATDSESFSAHSKAAVSSMLIDYLEKARDVGLSFEEVQSAAAILAFVLPGGVDEDGVPLSNALTKVYAEYMAYDMTEGQNPIRVINGVFRMISMSLNGLSNATVEAPLTTMETTFGKASQYAVIPGSTAGTGFKVVVVEDTTTASESTNSSQYVSVPMGIVFDGTPCDDTSESCTMLVTLQYSIELPPSINISDPDVVAFQCRFDEVVEHSYVCPTGDVLATYCNGSVAGTMTQQCPTYAPSGICKSIGSAYSQCEVQSFSSTNVTCECTIPFKGDEGRRRLQTDDSTTSEDETLRVDFVAAGSQVAVNFIETWKSANDIDSSDVKNSVGVLLTVALIGFMSIALMFIGYKVDEKHAQEEETNQVEKSRSSNAIVGSRSFPLIGSTMLSLMNVRKKSKLPSAQFRTKSVSMGNIEAKTVEAALPSVLRPLPVWRKFLVEAQVYHRWLGVITHTSRTFSRPLRILSLTMNILIVLFLEAVTYDLADPDDNTCEKEESEVTCLHAKSNLARGESKCYWREDKRSCHFRPVGQEFYRIVVVAIIVAVVGTPLALIIEAVISRYLAAEVVSDQVGPKQMKRSSSSVLPDVKTPDEKVVRRTVMMLRRAEEALGNTVEDDYNMMRTELTKYRDTLTYKDRREFDGMHSRCMCLVDNN